MVTHPKTVTHPITNRAQRRVTPLTQRQTATIESSRWMGIAMGLPYPVGGQEGCRRFSQVQDRIELLIHGPSPYPRKLVGSALVSRTPSDMTCPPNVYPVVSDTLTCRYSLHGLLPAPFLLSYSVFILFFFFIFRSGPCARLTWPSRQLLSAR